MKKKYLYILRGTNRYINPSINVIKIGISSNVDDRMALIQSNVPLNMKLLEKILLEDAEALESMFKRHYESRCMRGEWFALPKKELAKLIGYVRKIKHSEKKLIGREYEEDYRMYTEEGISVLDMLWVEDDVVGHLAEN